MPLPFVHILRDIRKKQIEHQNKEMNKSSNINNNMLPRGINPSAFDDIMDELT